MLRLLRGRRVLVAASFGACNPKIDASVLNDAGFDAFAPSAVPCHSQNDCKSADPCVTSRCDDGTEQCVYDYCPTGDQCSAASCTTVGKCGVSSSFGWHAGSFHVPAGLGCAACAAAVYPFLFVATDLDVVAFRVSDPTNSNPPQLDFGRLPFSPRAVFAAGRRVYFVGASTGASGAPLQVQVAWVDVPADPGAKTIEARVRTYPYPAPDLRFDGALVGNDDTIYFRRHVQTYENNQTVFRDQELAVKVEVGLDVGATDFFLAKSYPANGATVAVSGTRTVVYHNNAGVGTFSLDDKPGTNDANNLGEQPLPDVGVPGPSSFGQGPDGSAFWSLTTRILPEAGNQITISGVRLVQVLGDANASTFGAQARADLETYEPPLQDQTVNGTPDPNPLVGPIAPIGSGAVLALAAARENPAQTSVQLVQRSGGLQLAQGKRFLVPARVDQVAAASSDRFGYVVVPETPQSMVVHIFSPSCQ